MRRLVQNRIVLTILAAWLLYWPIAYIVPRDLLLEFINGMIAAMSIGIVAAYLPGSWEVLRRRPYRMTGGDLLMLGATIVQIAIACLFAWGWVYRLLDQPPYMVDHAFRGWLVYVLFIGSVLHLMAWEVEEKEHSLPTRGWVHLGGLIAIGLSMVVLLMLAANHI